MLHLYGDEVAGHLGHETTLALIADGAEEADKVATIGAEGCNVVPLVISVGAREGLAARDGSAAVQWEDLLDALSIIGVDNSRDIEVSGTSEAIETNLSEHAGDVCLAVGNGVPVPNPTRREGLVGGLGAGNHELGNGFQAGVGREVDGTLSAVLIDEVD